MKRSLFFSILSVLSADSSFSQGTWTKKASLPAGGRLTSFAFEINGKGYIGGGFGANPYYDLWEYSPANDSWTQKANYPGSDPSYGIGFAAGGKGYVGLSNTLSNDFWEYDPQLNSWTQKASLPGVGIAGSGAFSLGGKGYVTTGAFSASVLSQTTWEYSPTSDSWAQKADFPTARTDVDRAPFVIDCKAYVGTGLYFDSVTAYYWYNDFWQYDQGTNSWTQIASIPGPPRCGSTGFSLCGKGYLGLGATISSLFDDFWVYDPATNSWSIEASFPPGPRADAASFVIGNKAYVFGGNDRSSSYNDLWEFAVPGPCPTECSINEIRCGDIFIPNAFSPNNDNENDILMVYGGCIKEIKWAIYNRWGEKVFETNDPAEGWNGNYNGKAENSAVFVFYLEAVLTSGDSVRRKGNVSLIR